MEEEEKKEFAGERLAKVISRSGLGSRREIEGWIEEGRVTVNGQKVLSPALNVTEKDAIKVDGNLLAPAQAAKLWIYHKPRGLLTTHRDPQGRPTVFEKLPKTMPRVISIGRLDFNSEGLLLLTNDGALARKLEHPSHGWIRRYRVRAYGAIAPTMLAEMKKGLTIEGVEYKGIEAAIDGGQGDNLWLTVALTEGKNREIRRIFDHFGCRVNRLIRLSYGPFQLGSLPENEVKEVPEKVLKSFIGKD